MGLTYPSNKICPRCGTGGYVWYLDNSEYFAKCTNCGHYFREQDFPMCLLDKTQKPVTNYDRIINMTPEELAVFIAENAGCEWCQVRVDPECDQCAGNWLDWLKQEAET